MRVGSLVGSRNAEALITTLSDTLKGSAKSGKRGPRPSNRRVDIVSESLCGMSDPAYTVSYWLLTVSFWT